MRLVLVRHAEPDYEHDSLTPKGFREAELLAARAAHWRPDAVYVSPLGRAQDTARPLLEAMGKTAETLPWLEEFRARTVPYDETGNTLVWDFPPEVWTPHEALYDARQWTRCSLVRPNGALPNAAQEYAHVTAELDALLARYGYRRENRYYRCDNHSDVTLVLVCHMAVSFVMLSHLTGLPFVPLIQGMFLPPSSVTAVVTEELRPGAAEFRCEMLGDVRHLTSVGEPVSHSGLQGVPFGA